MKGYSSAALVGEELGRTLTAGQITQAEGLIESAEAYIDRHTGRAWLVTSPVTEVHPVVGGRVYLERTPVTAVTAVTVRSRSIGATATALVAGTSYELLDADRGILAVGDYTEDALVSVAYTHTSPFPLPADIRRATTLLVASWMTARLEPSAAGGLIESISVGQGDLAIRYRDVQAGDGIGVPDQVAAILRSWRRLVLV